MAFQLKKDQVYESIKNAINSGKYSGGEKLPRLTALCELHKVSMKTMRAAMKMLEDNGYLESIHGRGTFIRPRHKVKRYMILLMQHRPLENPENYILPGMETEAAVKGIELEHVYWEFLDQLTEEEAVKKIRNAGFDGILTAFHSFPINSKINNILKKSKLPVVLVRADQNDWKRTGFATVRFERARAFADGLQGIYDRGHRRICHLGHKHIEPGISFKQMLEMCNLKDADIRQCVVKFDDTDIYNKLAELLKHWKPTAILCFSDFFALKVYHALAELNIKIPQEISVMGAAGFPGGEYMSPALSTIDFNFFGSGSSGVKILNQSDKWFNNKEISPPEIFLDHKIVWRDSVCKRAEVYIK